jgi:cytochrome c-type biogenesis protein CcmH/NrfG
MRLNNDEKSLKLLRENLNYDNTHLQSHYNLAMLMQKTGKSAEAAKEMEIFNKLSSEKSADR